MSRAGAESGRRVLLSIALVFILSQAAALAQETGLKYAEVPTISHDTSRSYTVIEAEVENTGYDNVFICLPDSWTVDEEILNAYGENVLTSKTDIAARYGRKESRFSFIRNNFVFDFSYPVEKGSPIEITSSCKGWYVRPNERMHFIVKLKPGPATAIFDPLYLEKNYNYSKISVTRWSQEFRIYPDKSYGFFEAPYLVKRATMVEAYPGIFTNKSSLSDKPYYVEKFQNEENETTGIELSKVPSWNGWFGESSMFRLEPKMIASTKTNYFEIPPPPKSSASADEISFIPIWLFDAREAKFIQYSYEWRRDRQIEGGIDIDAYVKEEKPKIDLSKVPEWYSWF